jgi:hypothetical protein
MHIYVDYDTNEGVNLCHKSTQQAESKTLKYSNGFIYSPEDFYMSYCVKCLGRKKNTLYFKIELNQQQCQFCEQKPIGNHPIRAEKK